MLESPYLGLERTGLLPQLCPSGAGGRHGMELTANQNGMDEVLVPPDIPRRRSALTGCGLMP